MVERIALEPMPELDTSAILQGRKPGHRSVGLGIGIAVSVACAFGMLAYLLWAGLDTGGIDGVVGFALSVVAAVIPVTFLIPLVLLLDRLEPEPTSMLAFAFLWGAGVAVVASLLLNTMGMELYAVPVFGPDTGVILSTAVIAPVVEESAKGIVLLILLWRRRHEIDSYTDGVTYAAMVAIGFAFSENAMYFLTSFFEEGLFFTFVLRGLVVPLGHPIYTAMVGIGVAYAATHQGRARLIAPFAGWLAAVVLHAGWNTATTFGWTGFAIAYALLFGVLVVVVAAAALDRSRQVGAIASHLPQYVPTGLVTENDVRMLSSVTGRRLARRWAAHNAGHRGRTAMRDYQLAATELALLHQRMDRGVARPKPEKRRDQFLALMHVARDTFLGRARKPATPAWAPTTTESGFLTRADFSDVIARAHEARASGESGATGRPRQQPPPPEPEEQRSR